MADTSISNLPDLTPSSNTYVPISNGTTTGKALTNNLGGVPIGFIGMWSGSVIPTGWALCNGSNGTPDLRSRFIVGAGQGTGLTNYALSATGGVESVTLTTAQIPAHTHGYSYRDANYGGYLGGNPGYSPKGSLTSATTNSNTGGGGSHENRPPYYALAFIMRIS